MHYTRTLLDYQRPPPGAFTGAPRRALNVNMAMGVALLLGVTAGAYVVSPYLAAVIYAAGFILATWSKPGAALALILAAAPFQYDLSVGGPLRFSLAEINLVLTIPMWLFTPRPRGTARAWGLLLAVGGYFTVAVVSSVLHWRESSAMASLLQMWLYMIAATGVFSMLGRRPEDYLDALLALLGTCIFIANVTAMMRGGQVLGLHKNGLGASLAAGVVIGVELWLSGGYRVARPFVAVATLFSVVGLILSLSRGAWLAAIIGVLFILAMRRQFNGVVRAALVLGPAILITWLFLSPASREYVFNRSGDSLKEREKNIAFAQKHFVSSPVLGVGVGLRKEFDATNILWVTLAETGVTGAVAFVAIHAAIALMVSKLRRQVGPGDPRFTFVVLGGALILGRFAHGMFDHYWSRGAPLIAWACVGMLIHVHGEVFARRPRQAAILGPAGAWTGRR